MKTKTIIPFLAITFGLNFGLAGLLFLFYDQIVAIFGEITASNPLFILAVYSPGIAGIFLVWWHYGLKGLGKFLRRLTLWRAPVAWWIFLILGIPALVFAGAVFTGSISDPFPYAPWYGILPVIVAALFLGPIEEFGWRGVAQPLLQRKFSPFWSALILGGIWGLWHIPAFLIGGTPQSAWEFGPYFLGLVAIAVILTPLFNASRGSLLIAALFHFQIMNPAFPDAQPWDIYLFILTAIIVVWLNRHEMFRLGSGVTEVLPTPEVQQNQTETDEQILKAVASTN